MRPRWGSYIQCVAVRFSMELERFRYTNVVPYGLDGIVYTQ